MPSHDDELDQMKRHPLGEIAAALGYVVVRKKSSRSTSLMRHPATGHKIVISVRAGSGHYTFYSIGGSRGQAGSCIDLLQLVYGERFTLGNCRQYLRPFINGTIPQSARPRPDSYAATLLPTSPDVELARATFAAIATPLEEGRQAYLNGTRKLSPQFLSRPHFSQAVFQDRRGNAIFPHRDRSGEITGFDCRGPDRKAFSKGGVKSLWFADPGREEREALCIGEAPISVLSYAALHYDPRACYLATSGAFSPLQADLIASAIAKLPPSALLTVAADADQAGEAFAARILEIWSASGREDAHVKIHQPSSAGASDWNDELVRRAEPSAPAVSP